jgi:ABC-2 type transport system permease protein
MAAMLAGLVLVASYVLSSMASLDSSLTAIAQLLPYDYYQGGAAVDGLRVDWLAGLLIATVLLSSLGWWRYLRRDIRVVGEGGWRWAAWARAARVGGRR